MTITKDLQAISKELTKLVNQIEKLAAALGKTEQPRQNPSRQRLKQRLSPKRHRLKVARKLIPTRSLQSSIDPRKVLILPH